MSFGPHVDQLLDSALLQPLDKAAHGEASVTLAVDPSARHGSRVESITRTRSRGGRSDAVSR
jgi:hypothetical protein